MGLLRMLFWVALFLASTFAFTVLFEHGTTNYMQNVEKEFDGMKKLYQQKTDAKPKP